MKYLQAVLAVILALAPQVAAAQVVDRCQAAKIKAAGRKTFDKAKCRAKALTKGTAIDPLCLTKAETKFEKAVTKADTLGSCSGTAADLEAAVDQCVDTYAAVVSVPVTVTTTTATSLTTTTTLLCCNYPRGTGIPGCTWVLSETSCGAGGAQGSLGSPGSVCDGVTGDCMMTAAPGDCCQLEPVIVSGNLMQRCAGGVPSAMCADNGGTFVPNVTCMSNGLCQ